MTESMQLQSEAQIDIGPSDEILRAIDRAVRIARIKSWCGNVTVALAYVFPELWEALPLRPKLYHYEDTDDFELREWRDSDGYDCHGRDIAGEFRPDIVREEWIDNGPKYPRGLRTYMGSVIEKYGDQTMFEAIEAIDRVTGW